MVRPLSAIRPVKLGLQIALGLMSLIALYFGALGLVVGVAPNFEGDPPPILDNQARYSSGVYLVFAFLLWWIIPNVERHKMPIRIISAAMMCGGLGRLVSLMRYGSGHDVQLILMVMEIGAPLLILWQKLATDEASRASLNPRSLQAD